MPATVNPRGLVPSRTLRGSTSFAMTIRPTRGANTRQIYPGDMVFLNANGRVQPSIVATVAGQPQLGVVGAVYNKRMRPLTHNLPATSSYIPVSTTGFVGVYEDPDIIYTANCSASVGDSAIGLFANIVLNAANTAAGISGMCVDGVDVTATSQGHPLKIVALSSNEILSNDPQQAVGATTGANYDVEVLIINHVWRNNRYSRTLTAA